MNNLFSRAALTALVVGGALLSVTATPVLAQADDNRRTRVDIQIDNPAVVRDANNNVIFRVMLCNNGAAAVPAGYLGLIRIVNWPNGGGYLGHSNVAVPALAPGECVTIAINFGRHPAPAGAMVQLKVLYYEPNKLGKAFYSNGLQIPPRNSE